MVFTTTKMYETGFVNRPLKVENETNQKATLEIHAVEDIVIAVLLYMQGELAHVPSVHSSHISSFPYSYEGLFRKFSTYSPIL